MKRCFLSSSMPTSKASHTKKKLKKPFRISFAMFLTAAVLAGSAIPAAAENTESATATAAGLDETVTVTLTMQDGTITDVDAATDKENSEVGEAAIGKIPGEIVEANSVKVDAVTGATITSNAIIAAATDAYLQIIGEDLNLDAWAKGNGYLKAEDFQMEAGTDAVTSATVSGQGGINFGDIELPDDLKKELILDYLHGAEGNYREMYQIATSYNNTPTVGTVEYVLDPEDMTLFGSSETNTAKLNNMLVNPQVDLYWVRQIREGDICSEDVPVLPSYFMSYGVEITGTFKAIHWAELSDEEQPVYLSKARNYFETLGAQYAQLTAMEEDAFYEYLCNSPMNFYQIVPERYVITSPWFLNVYDTGYARQFVSEELQTKLADAAAEQYPEAEGLTVLDPQTFTATGLKTQQILTIP